MEFQNGHLKLLLNLYFSNFDKKKGTLTYIAKSLGSPNGHTRALLSRLVKEEVLKLSEYDDINGKVHEVYSLDKEKLINFLKNDSIFKRIYLLLYEEADSFAASIPKIYPKDEFKGLQEEIKWQFNG